MVTNDLGDLQKVISAILELPIVKINRYTGYIAYVSVLER